MRLALGDSRFHSPLDVETAEQLNGGRNGTGGYCVKLNDHQCPALVRGARLQPDPKTGEPMLLFPEGVIHLSETANDVLLLCDGKTTLGTLISSLAEQYEIEPNVVSKDVRECLIELMGHNLITI